MKKVFIKLSLLAISILVFTVCTIEGANYKQDLIVYSDGYIDNGNIKNMNTTALYGFTDEGRDNNIYKGSLGIPENGKVQLGVKAITDSIDKMSISFKDGGGNIIFEETSSSIFFSKTIDAKKGEWYFQIKGDGVKTGDFKFIVLKK